MAAPAPGPSLAAALDGRRPRPVVPEPFPAARRARVSVRLRPAAVVLAASTFTFSGLAAAGALPGPIQRASAALGSHIVIWLPGASHPAPVQHPAAPADHPAPTPPPLS